MHIVHASLFVASLCTVAVAAAAGGRLRRSDEHLQLLGLVIGGALAAGNAVSLLPGTPAWYSTSLVVLTLAGLVWLAGTYVAELSGARRDGRYETGAVLRPAVRPENMRPEDMLPERPEAARPATRPETRSPARDSAPLYGHAGDEPVDAEVVTDAPVVPLFRERVAVTQDDLHDLGPAGSRSAAGQGTYVAADLGRYLAEPTPAQRRAARRHGILGAQGAELRLRLRRVYGEAPDPQGRVHSRRA